MTGVIYHATNEDLASIVELLKPCPGDRIAAICGSGDQAFALAEHGAQVTAVDMSWEQIVYARTRADALREGNITRFLRYLKYFRKQKPSNCIKF